MVWSLWWMWQICLAFVIKSLMNVVNAGLPSAMDYLKALPFTSVLKSILMLEDDMLTHYNVSHYNASGANVSLLDAFLFSL
jgi:hypothetical protein